MEGNPLKILFYTLPSMILWVTCMHMLYLLVKYYSTFSADQSKARYSLEDNVKWYEGTVPLA